MTDLVTGGAGFLGFHLARSLARAGGEILVTDNFVRSTRDARFDELAGMGNVTFAEGDLCDPAFVSGLPDVRRVFHLAALNGTQNFYERPFETIKNSTTPALNLIERYMPGGLDLFAYTGSSESYAGSVRHGLTTVPTPENAPLLIETVTNPRWSYAVAKLHGEVAVATAAQQYGVAWQIWRVHNCFGPRMGAKHVIPDFTERATHDVFELYGSDNMRTFLYVEDAVSIMTRLAEAPAASGEIVNVGGIEEMTMLDLGHRILEVMGKSGAITERPSPDGSIARRRPDISKLTSILGEIDYTPFERSLRITVEDIVCDVAQGRYDTK